jgi:glycosyltransferase involved in cell wall biosynthesis
VVPQAKLQLYGQGSGKGALQEQVKQLGLENSISINDFVQDVAAVYESAGLSILTSQGEGFSLVVLERSV